MLLKGLAWAGKGWLERYDRLAQTSSFKVITSVALPWMLAFAIPVLQF
jgi:hypothetical protein